MKLYEAFSQIKTEKEFNDFLSDLLTPREIKSISERWKIADKLYNSNLPQDTIAAQIGAGKETVTRVARFLYNENFKGYMKVLSRLYPKRAEKLAKDQIGRLTAASRIHHA